jgi:hypothetical protein
MSTASDLPRMNKQKNKVLAEIRVKQRNKMWPGIVAHTCNPSYRPDQAKKVTIPHLNRRKMGTVVHTCHPSYNGK